MKIETVPCTTCGEATTFTGTKLCNACWEVERSLDLYLRRGGKNARRFVQATLAAEGATDEVVEALELRMRDYSRAGLEAEAKAAEQCRADVVRLRAPQPSSGGEK